MNKIAAATLAALATLFTSAHAVDQPTFEPLYRAAKAMEAAAVSDVSYERFSELAQRLATELLAAKDQVQSDEDRALVMLYAQAGLAYGDSLAFWREKIRSSSAKLPSSTPSIAPLVARYALSTEGEVVDADSAMRLINSRIVRLFTSSGSSSPRNGGIASTTPAATSVFTFRVSWPDSASFIHAIGSPR